MNRRQKKKQFKRRFGFNPPRSISIKAAASFNAVANSNAGFFTASHRFKIAFLIFSKAVIMFFRRSIM